MEEANKPKLSITMSKICRSCMNESSDLQSIFAKLEMVGLETQLSEMLTACASIQVSYRLIFKIRFLSTNARSFHLSLAFFVFQT